jgi:hypothetical protein
MCEADRSLLDSRAHQSRGLTILRESAVSCSPLSLLKIGWELKIGKSIRVAVKLPSN